MVVGHSKMDKETNKLDEQSVALYWESVSVPLSRLFEVMREREYWLDGNAETGGRLLIEALEAVIERLEDDDFLLRLDESSRVAVLAQLFSCTSMPLFVRTLSVMDSKKAGVVSRLAHAMSRVSGEPEVFVNLYFERMEVVLKTSMLGQIFSSERIKLMAETMKYIKEGAL